MERKYKSQKRKNIIFWLVIVIIGLLLILGSALYFSNKTVAKQTYNIQTDIELDSGSSVVVPISHESQPSEIEAVEEIEEPYPVQAEVTPTEEQESLPVVTEQTQTTETEQETEQEAKDVEAEVLEDNPIESEV